MTDLTDKTFDHWRKTKFQYGVEDCLLSIADHAVRFGHRDAGVMFRGNYDTKEQAEKIVKDFGGFEKMIALIGLSETDEPKRGDIVLVRTAFGFVGGVHSGHGVSVRMPHGVIDFICRMVRIEKAWSIK